MPRHSTPRYRAYEGATCHDNTSICTTRLSLGSPPALPISGCDVGPSYHAEDDARDGCAALLDDGAGHAPPDDRGFTSSAMRAPLLMLAILAAPLRIDARVICQTAPPEGDVISCCVLAIDVNDAIDLLRSWRRHVLCGEPDERRRAQFSRARLFADSRRADRSHECPPRRLRGRRPPSAAAAECRAFEALMPFEALHDSRAPNAWLFRRHTFLFDSPIRRWRCQISARFGLAMRFIRDRRGSLAAWRGDASFAPRAPSRSPRRSAMNVA